ncbi:DUF1707 SHOCT-like domain-containing protein [Jiangella asiatica]|uniref:DUF1707 and DUF2154 domain-containing protein n=1 Tax=Jiangella asiatica TaxID=2530372 RepID=A0A4R5DEP2_9ACTN|nr:DUF1707 domain-containing protein [Jiangella asiatica]TDE09085.1 DUF1707 and DUF2154 domain-containing protein [Jiangella asiatica]
MSEVPDVRSAADLRCSDVDRERVAEALRQAAGDGRLTLSELEERLEATFSARTYGDLQPITRDLPQGPYPLPGGTSVTHWQQGRVPPPNAPVAGPRVPNAPVAGAAAGATPLPAAGGPLRPSERITTVLSTEKRKGRWEVPARMDVTSVLGEVVLDFTEAIVRSREIEIQVGVVLGSITLIVPEGIDVRLEEGANILGERRMKLKSEVTPGSPIYHVRGFVFLGELTVRPPRERRSLLGH